MGNCTTVDEVLTHKVCTPKVEKKCEDVVFTHQKITFETECKDVTTKHCSDGTYDVTEGEPEAEADPQLLYGHGLPVLPCHHTTVEIKEHCVEHTAKHCVDKPVSEDVETKVPHCVLVHGADCEDVETTVPKTTCV